VNRYGTLASIGLLACAASAAAFEVTPVALDVEPGSAQPSVSVDPGHGFIVTWQTRVDTGARLQYASIDRAGAVTATGVIADSRRSGADGGPATWFVNWADFPSLVVLDNGDWVTHWLQKNGAGTYAYEIRVTRSTDRGRSWSPAVVPHTDGTETEHGFVAMVPAGGDRVRLVWLDGRETAAAGHDHADGDHHAHVGRMTLRSAVLDRRGRLREEAQLDASTCSCCQTDMVRTGTRTVVAYRDHGDAELRNIHWLAHERGGWTRERAVHDDGWRIAGCPVNGPALAAGQAGILAVWPTLQGDTLHVRAALGDASGFGAPVDLEADARAIGRVDAAAWGDGFLATWLGAGTSEGSSALRVAELDTRLARRSLHVLAELPPGRSTGVPRLAADEGVALLAWVDSVDTQPVVRVVRLRQDGTGGRP
jgi:hypothetical protein